MVFNITNIGIEWWQNKRILAFLSYEMELCDPLPDMFACSTASVSFKSVVWILLLSLLWLYAFKPIWISLCFKYLRKLPVALNYAPRRFLQERNNFHVFLQYPNFLSPPSHLPTHPPTSHPRSSTDCTKLTCGKTGHPSVCCPVAKSRVSNCSLELGLWTRQPSSQKVQLHKHKIDNGYSLMTPNLLKPWPEKNLVWTKAWWEFFNWQRSQQFLVEPVALLKDQGMLIFAQDVDSDLHSKLKRSTWLQTFHCSPLVSYG